jgi:hypothetical protein
MDIYDIKECLDAFDKTNKYKVITTTAGDLFYNNGFDTEKITESIIKFGLFDKNNNIEEFKNKLNHDIEQLNKTFKVFFLMFDDVLPAEKTNIKNINVDELVDKNSSVLVNNFLSKKNLKLKV